VLCAHVSSCLCVCVVAGECECGRSSTPSYTLSSTPSYTLNGEEGADDNRDKRDKCRQNTLSTPRTPVQPPYPEEGVSRYGGEPASPNLTPLKALQQKRLPRAQAVATHTTTPHRAPAPPLGTIFIYIYIYAPRHAPRFALLTLLFLS
jgi:hypothetical protein